MSATPDNRPSDNFWIISWAALIWYLIGLTIYVGQVSMSAESLARLTVAQQEFHAATPVWSNAAWAIAVNAGIVACILMLLRKAWAVPVFALSLVAVAIQDVDLFVLRDLYGLAGISSLLIPTMVFVIGISMYIYSRAARNRGWLS